MLQSLEKENNERFMYIKFCAGGQMGENMFNLMEQNVELQTFVNM